MNPQAKALLRSLLPPVLLAAWHRWHRADPVREPVRYKGDYASWAEAQRDAEGYAAPVILERTRAALSLVRDGQAASERDSVVLAQPEPPMAVLAALLRAAAERGGRLHVLDFGGSLGSTYYQCRSFLSPLVELRWSIVELAALAACGRTEFADGHLAFYDSMEELLAGGARPDVLLLSSVLPYLPDPHGFLTLALQHRFRSVVIDRTACWPGAHDRLTVQKVPAWIYPASYPAWFFNEAGLEAHFEPAYNMLASFHALDRPELSDALAWSRGYIYRLRHE
ncbi:MAG: methyltransferase, TIGR04325 family [Opitutales bacterium]